MLPLTIISDSVDIANPALDALVALHTRTVDTLPGYDKMLEKAEPEFRPVVARFRELHGQHATDLAAILAARGEPVDGEGSMMGVVNRAVVAVRSFFDDIDADVMKAIRNGEETVMSAFDNALMQPLEPAETLDIGEMRDELVALLGSSPAST